MNDIQLPKEFTHHSYRQLLESLSNSHSFATLDSLNLASTRPLIALRHDIDVHPSYAFPLFEIECDLGIVSTTYLRVNAELYSASEAASHVLHLRKHGHLVGLHFEFDCNVEQGYEAQFAHQLDLFSNAYGFTPTTYTDHRPHALDVHRPECLGVPQAYFDLERSRANYISDSRGVWNHAPQNCIGSVARPHLVLLLHPVWWRTADTSPSDCLREAAHWGKPEAFDKLCRNLRAEPRR